MALFLKNTFNIVLHNTAKNVTPIYVSSIGSFARKFSAEVIPANTTPEEAEEKTFETEEKERVIELKRNVSRLNPQHRNLVHNRVPYPEPKAEFHVTVKYRRKMYGQFGSSSGVNAGVMWPTKEDIEDRKEYEKVAYPLTVQEMVREELSKREAEEAEIWERQKKIADNFKKLEKWVDDLESRRAKKIQVAIDAKAKNDKLIEEVRRHFGYTVDHREEKFKQMLEQKIKEEKKLAKLERKKKRDEAIVQDLMSMAQKVEEK